MRLKCVLRAYKKEVGIPVLRGKKLVYIIVFIRRNSQLVYFQWIMKAIFWRFLIPLIFPIYGKKGSNMGNKWDIKGQIIVKYRHKWDIEKCHDVTQLR